LNHILADQGLPAGYADFRYPPARRDGGDAEDFFVPQHLRMTELRDPLARHAVLAPEIAAVGNRNSEIIDFPVMGVDQRFHLEREKIAKKIIS
jgi:hypothetical protein